jgi:hypothetical protein
LTPEKNIILGSRLILCQIYSIACAASNSGKHAICVATQFVFKYFRGPANSAKATLAYQRHESPEDTSSEQRAADAMRYHLHFFVELVTLMTKDAARGGGGGGKMMLTAAATRTEASLLIRLFSVASN